MKIVLSVVLAMFLVGCSSDESKSSKQEVSGAKSVVQNSAPQAQPEKEVEKTTTQAAAEELKAEVKKEVEQKVEAVKEAVKEETKPVKIPMNVETIKPEQQVVASNNGKMIFQACVACHGPQAQNKALGRSQIIQGWDAAKVQKALHGYQDGSYGGPMKGIMKAQASKLSNDDIKAVADYISKL